MYSSDVKVGVLRHFSIPICCSLSPVVVKNREWLHGSLWVYVSRQKSISDPPPDHAKISVL
ncbi:hypothetical protein QC761_0046280 [Podospora bellae-mahoneyi]|uniref:Uncharacterized protein n=1 Tax=Podospora bellae-mahoneyi TaxID=2093777 RepID=A0ABR0FUR5_9PEZI|nr:hypothetical protein QC761_0046280 [Podospora bellae-mahoneyi]